MDIFKELHTSKKKGMTDAVKEIVVSAYMLAGLVPIYAIICFYMLSVPIYACWIVLSKLMK